MHECRKQTSLDCSIPGRIDWIVRKQEHKSTKRAFRRQAQLKKMSIEAASGTEGALFFVFAENSRGLE